LNFKILSLLILLCGCGVKGDPSIPREASVPSVLHNYEDIEINAPLEEAKQR